MGQLAVDYHGAGVFRNREYDAVAPDMPPFPNLHNGPWLGGMDEFDDGDVDAIARWWTDPELNRQRAMTWFENNYFGGEALPPWRFAPSVEGCRDGSRILPALRGRGHRPW